MKFPYSKSAILLGIGFIACTMPLKVNAQNRIQIQGREIVQTLSNPLGDLANAYDTLLGNSKKWRNASLILGGLVLTDWYTTMGFQTYIEPTEPLFRVVPVGNPYAQTLLHPILGGIDGVYANGIGGVYLAGTLFNVPKWREAALIGGKVSLEGFVISHLLLKTAFARQRPLRPLQTYDTPPLPQDLPFTNNPFDFFNWKPTAFLSNADATAMPSFHFTLYFGLAAVADYYLAPWWIAYPVCLFPLGYILTGHNHWVSDMVAGAFIGTSLAYGAIHRYETSKKKLKVRGEKSISFAYFPSGMKMVYQF